MQQRHGSFILLQKLGDLGAVSLSKLLAHHHAALHQRALTENGVPFRRQVQHHLQLVVGAAGNGHHRLGQHRQCHLTGRHSGPQVGRLSIGVVHRHVDTGLVAQGLENKGGVLGRSVHRLSLQIGQRADTLAAVGHHVQHAQRIQGQHLHGAAGLVVHHAGGVGGQGRNVHAAADKGGGNVAGVGLHGNVVVQGCFALGGLADKLGHAEAGGAVERHDADRQLAVHLIGSRYVLTAGAQAQHQSSRQQQCKNLANLHGLSSF